VNWKHIFARKDLEALLAEAAGEHRLHRVLGPWSLTALGIGCIIGAGIFVMTGRAAAQDAGPAVVLSYAIAGLGCVVAAMCYAEFAAMAPVAGSAYTYAYTTLGEIFAWIIGWDLILEYAMGCATVASAWTHYFNVLLESVGLPPVPAALSHDPFWSKGNIHGIFNLPSVLIMGLVTAVLIIGIRESARTNATLVLAKLAVVLFVIAAGWGYVRRENWTQVSVARRALPQEKKLIPDEVDKYLDAVRNLELAAERYPGLIPAEMKKQFAGNMFRRPEDNPAVCAAGPDGSAADDSGERAEIIKKQVVASYRIERQQEEIARLQQEGKLSTDLAQAELQDLTERLAGDLPQTAQQRQVVTDILSQVEKKQKAAEAESWGMLGLLGLNRWLVPLDDATRSPFMPYGLSGLMLGASIVFFAFIGFDSISTHAEEARRPQRDVPIGILVSLSLCTLLYILVAAVVTGMVPYPEINTEAPIAAAFAQQATAQGSLLPRIWAAVIAVGGLAGMTSVLLVLFLSQARIFMAMSRDGLLPKVFGTVHPRFRTPHVATLVTGAVICITAALTPIYMLEEMVNIGTLMAFAMVCGAVLVLRKRRPEAKRPFRCPLLFVVAPLGILLNVLLMLFLPLGTWLRLVIWLAVGLVIYFTYSLRHSHLAQHLMQEIRTPLKEVTGTNFDPEVVE
jgi:amino acid transporter